MSTETDGKSPDDRHNWRFWHGRKPAETTGSHPAAGLSELQHLEANYRSTRRRIGAGQWMCTVWIFAALVFFAAVTAWILFGQTSEKFTFLNSPFTLTVIGLSCTAMLLTGLIALLLWFYFSRMRIRLENNYDNLKLHLILETEHVVRERSALAQELQGHSHVTEAIVERAAYKLQALGKHKSAFLLRSDTLHRMMDEALHIFSMNEEHNETE